MKKVYLVIVLMMLVTPIFCTMQEPDKIIYLNTNWSMDVDVGHYSPIEVYFKKNNISWPFEMISTGNYRGCIASWEIVGDELFLIGVTGNINNEIVDLKLEKYFKIGTDLKVLASWFTGIISIQNNNVNIEDRRICFIKVEKGRIIESESFKQIEVLKKIRNKETIDSKILQEYSLYLKKIEIK